MDFCKSRERKKKTQARRATGFRKVTLQSKIVEGNPRGGALKATVEGNGDSTQRESVVEESLGPGSSPSAWERRASLTAYTKATSALVHAQLQGMNSEQPRPIKEPHSWLPATHLM